jgi:endonuclease/exonuclease/phosphatase family metal-dependent hydrolase
MTDGTVRLLTLNTLFKGDVRARVSAMGELFERSGHDIICLQEVLWRGLLRGLAPSYPHRFAQGRLVLHGGLVLLSRWPITRAAFTRYPTSGPRRPELLMRKGAQVAVVQTPAGALAVVNTHLSANRDDDWAPANRYSMVAAGELARLAELIAAIDPELPLVMVGDLNVPRQSTMLADFVGAVGLRDVLAGDTRPTYRPTPQWPTPPALDHVLLRSGRGVSLDGTAELVFQDAVTLSGGRSAYLSDHFGVAATLRLS